MRISNRSVFVALASIAIVVLAGVFLVVKRAEAPSGSVSSAGDPMIVTETVVDGLSNPWDVAQAPDKTLFYTERANKIGAVLDGKATTIAQPEGVIVRGEGGMLGMTLDPQFAQNRYIYTCFNTATDVRLVRFTVANDNRSVSDRTDIVTGMPVNPSGRHSGCRPRFSPDQLLWIGTGDTARSEHPQSVTSLGGKVLRVDREGKAVDGNMPAPFDSRIYSYGHRNVQGLVFYSQPRAGVTGYSIEHGSSRDDEVNELVTGNFGWDPGEGYDESVDMTDLKKYPNAIKALWSSGRSTIAPSGAVILEGTAWKNWQDRMLMAVQKDQHVRMFTFDQTAKTITDEQEVLDQFGRIRSLTNGTDGSVYMTTDNGNGRDQIVKITPR